MDCPARGGARGAEEQRGARGARRLVPRGHGLGWVFAAAHLPALIISTRDTLLLPCGIAAPSSLSSVCPPPSLWHFFQPAPGPRTLRMGRRHHRPPAPKVSPPSPIGPCAHSGPGSGQPLTVRVSRSCRQRAPLAEPVGRAAAMGGLGGRSPAEAPGRPGWEGAAGRRAAGQAQAGSAAQE